MNAPVKAQQGAKTPKNQAKTSFAALWKPALKQAFVKLDPRQLLRSPVMLVVEITAVPHHAAVLRA